MVACLAAPLAVRGARIGVLMGTAYLFTEEAVATGAISPVFQQAALACAQTVLVHTAPGHATRCVDSAFVQAFEAERRRLEAEGAAPDSVWESLERMNLGRLRIASKGLVREGDALVAVDEDAQRRDGMFMIGQLAALRGEVTTVAALHDEVSAGATAWLADPPLRREGAGLDIAVVGMAAVLPGAPDVHTYWSRVVLGQDAVTEVPRERWDPERYHNAEPEHRGGTTRSKWGGFLPAVPFDPLEYGIPPRSLAAIDPVQLLALQVARDALADAGYDRRPLDRDRTSVVFGAEPGTDLASAYGLRAQLPALIGEIPEALDRALPRLTEDSFPGVLGNVIAGRIANRLDLGGVNYTVDAACASSLAALDVACKELVAGTSDCVVVGGADLHNAVNDYLLFDSVHALSPTGRSRPFDADADGISLGEGVAAVVCKRLADAERDGDRIYAVIKGIAGSSDGRSLGLTAPRREGQTAALDRAYDRAGLGPERVGLVEAHGTGTVVGDRTELASLTETFTQAGVEAGKVTLGSVKSNIGHTKCAAGLAGLVKVALALHQGVLPPSLHIRKPNPGWRAQTSPFQFRSRPAPWGPGERYAAISAFGFGGTNFHAVLAAHDAAPAAEGHRDWPEELVLLEDLAAAQRLASWLDAGATAGVPAPALADVALTVAPAAGSAGLALLARDVAELRELLGVAARGETHERVLRRTGATAPRVAWLLPGQGSQRPGMLADLFVAFPALQALLAGGWAERLFPGDAYDPASRKAQRAALTDTRVAQPALGIVELAAARVLERAGLRADVLAGHSYGEVVALCLAGALREDQLVALSEARADAVVEAAGAEPGTMAAVTAPAEAVAPHLAGSGAVVANANSPQQTVIAGPAADVDRAVARLEAAGLEVKRFPVAAAFHSPGIAAAGPAFAEALGAFDVGAPDRPVWANTTAAPYAEDPAEVRRQLAEQIVRPVRFADQVRAMAADGVTVFVEVGPGRVLTDLVEQTLGAGDHLAVPLDHRDGALVGLARLLGALAARGVPVDLPGLLRSRGARPLDLDAAPALSPTTWWVDGHRARPAVGELPDHAMKPLAEPIALTAAAGRDRVVLEYLETLREQAEAQRRVMLAYLGSDAPVEALPVAAAAEEAPAPAPAAPTDPGELLLGIVSERTGYPSEMLDLDLDLEADLSIDSIKRVEILGALADQLGEGGGRAEQEQVVEELAGVRTLRGVLTWLETRRTSAGGGATDLEVDPSTDGEGIPPRALRFVPELTPLDPPAPGSLAEARVAVVGAGELVASLAEPLAATGAVVVGDAEPHSLLVVVTDPADPPSGRGCTPSPIGCGGSSPTGWSASAW
ncbi:MAG: beta-ketoacyl synthase N-terminal-like domain-containing protein [Myxococcota bacterium]